MIPASPAVSLHWHARGESRKSKNCHSGRCRCHSESRKSKTVTAAPRVRSTARHSCFFVALVPHNAKKEFMVVIVF